jgi:hypothetical protein
VSDQAALLQAREEGGDGGVGALLRQCPLHLGHGGLLTVPQNAHDLELKFRQHPASPETAVFYTA